MVRVPQKVRVPPRVMVPPKVKLSPRVRVLLRVRVPLRVRVGYQPIERVPPRVSVPLSSFKSICMSEILPTSSQKFKHFFAKQNNVGLVQFATCQSGVPTVSRNRALPKKKKKLSFPILRIFNEAEIRILAGIRKPHFYE